ncbi:MAG: hypothetical protein AMS18_15305 [Gemmatimonas sp. SG8_17]|nr:MAG: hypothetical protein AMS18_15305 [Gemmatimonas sp. SG8_17]
MLCEMKDDRQRTVLKGEFSTVFIEVAQGGHGVEGDPYQRLTNLIITPVKRQLDGGGWEKAGSVFVRLDENAVEFLAQALKRVSSGQELGVVRPIQAELDVGRRASTPKKDSAASSRWGAARR